MTEQTTKERNKCGIIMPISSIDGCDESHWLEVREILSDSIDSAEFEANLVSDADDIGIIQKRIIQNIYENPIVVCDVSGKNPNVMFELGMRLAFDKPTIIVKDNKTSYSFDTSPIEHIEYPRDLRFPQIVEFKKSLSKKIKATYTASTSDPNYTTFLKNFGTFTVAKLDEKEVSGNEMILSEIHDLRNTMLSFSKRISHSEEIRPSENKIPKESDLIINGIQKAIEQFKKEHNITRKTDMRKHKEEICMSALGVVDAPSYFENKRAWTAFFNSIFDLMY